MGREIFLAKIGIPRTLAYFIYYPFWHVFFNELGHEIIVSPPTTRAILDAGVEEAVNDACIPIKIYHGHVAYLKDKVDFLFSPRLVGLRSFGDFKTETFCPKFLGLPDMIRAAMEDLPPIIDTRIDLRRGGPGKHFWKASDKPSMEKVCDEIGERLGESNSVVRRAVREARQIQEQFFKLLEKTYLPETAMRHLLYGEELVPAQKGQKFAVAVVGYPYCIYDPYINVGLLKILEKEGFRIYTQDMLHHRVLERSLGRLPKDMFWYFSNRAVGGAIYYAARPEIDGIIHVTAFACGPDAMVDRTMELEIRAISNKPYLSVMIDEQTGEAGIQTRIEAFADMLRYRREGGA